MTLFAPCCSGGGARLAAAWSWIIPVRGGLGRPGRDHPGANYSLFEGYYVWGHVTGGELPIRRLEAGLFTLRDDLVYYPRVVLWGQLTRSFDDPALATLLLASLAACLARVPPARGW